MSTHKSPEQLKTALVGHALTTLLKRVRFAEKNAAPLLTLMEKLAGDANMTATEKKTLLGKINSYYLMSTDDLLSIVDELSAVDAPETVHPKIHVTMSEEVEKWAH